MSTVGREDLDQTMERSRLLGREAAEHRRIAVAYEKCPAEPPPSVEAALRARRACDDAQRAQCGLLRELVGTLADHAAEQSGKLTAMEEQNRRLSADCERLRLELRRQLGVQPKRMGSAGEPDAGESKAGGEENGETNGPKRRGAPKGHRGASRGVPERVDRTEEIPPPGVCPCGCAAIEPMDEFDLKWTEDIPPVCRVVTLSKYRRGRCPDCGTVLRHDEAVHGPPVVTGPNLAVMLTTLRHMGMTYRRLASLCTDCLAIPLTASGVLGVVNGVCDRLRPVADEIASALREQEVIGADETGWRIERESGYVWCFCNKLLAYFHPDRSRATAVPEGVLGKEFRGTVTCDFYGAYNFLENTQRCWVHLLRDIEKERLILPGSKTLRKFEDEAWAVYKEGKRVQAMEDGPGKRRDAGKFIRRVRRLGNMKVPKGKATTLAKRVRNYADELVAFIDNPQVEPHNNRTERQVRPIVVNRKNSYGSDTAGGAKRMCDLASVLETCKLNGLRIGRWLADLLAAPQDTPPSPFEKPAKS